MRRPSMFRLFWSNLKMLVRNRQALFWTLMFPIMFTIIFGFFFGKGSFATGTVALINNSNTKFAGTIEESLKNSELFKVDEVGSVADGRDLMKHNKAVAIVE